MRIGGGASYTPVRDAGPDVESVSSTDSSEKSSSANTSAESKSSTDKVNVESSSSKSGGFDYGESNTKATDSQTTTNTNKATDNSASTSTTNTQAQAKDKSVSDLEIKERTVGIEAENTSKPTSKTVINDDRANVDTTQLPGSFASYLTNAESAFKGIVNDIKNTINNEFPNSPALADAFMAQNGLTSKKTITEKELNEVNRNLEDLVVTKNDMNNGDVTSTDPRRNQLKMLESMFEKLVSIKDDPMLKDELSERPQGGISKTFNSVKEKNFSGLGLMRMQVPFAKIPIAASESYVANHRATELKNISEQGFTQHPMADALMSVLEHNQDKKAISSAVGATVSGATTSLTPGVGEAIAAPMNMVIDAVVNKFSSLIGQNAADTTNSLLDSALGEEFVDGVDEQIASIGSKMGAKQAASALISKGLLPDNDKLTKNSRIDPENSETSLGTAQVVQSLLSYLAPPAHSDRLEGESDISNMEASRLGLREELFGLKPDQKVTPLSTGETRQLRNHTDLHNNAKTEETQPLLDPRQFADSMTQGHTDALTLALSSDIDARMRLSEQSFFRDTRGDNMLNKIPGFGSEDSSDSASNYSDSFNGFSDFNVPPVNSPIGSPVTPDTLDPFAPQDFQMTDNTFDNNQRQEFDQFMAPPGSSLPFDMPGEIQSSPATGSIQEQLSDIAEDLSELTEVLANIDELPSRPNVARETSQVSDVSDLSDMETMPSLTAETE